MRDGRRGGRDILRHAADVTGETGDPLGMGEAEDHPDRNTNFLSAAGMARRVVPQTVGGGHGRAEKVVATVALLCSDRATFTNGAVCRVDGGAVATMNP